MRTKREERQDKQTISDGEPVEAETKIRTETLKRAGGNMELLRWTKRGKKKKVEHSENKAGCKWTALTLREHQSSPVC